MEILFVRSEELVHHARFLNDRGEPHRQDRRDACDSVHNRLMRHQVVAVAEGPVQRYVTHDRGDLAVRDERYRSGRAEPVQTFG